MGTSPSQGMLVAYNTAHDESAAAAGVPAGRPRRASSNYDLSPSGAAVPICQSPPNMEGPISFVAPALAEETLMDVSLTKCTLIYLNDSPICVLHFESSYKQGLDCILVAVSDHQRLDSLLQKF